MRSASSPTPHEYESWSGCGVGGKSASEELIPPGTPAGPQID